MPTNVINDSNGSSTSSAVDYDYKDEPYKIDPNSGSSSSSQSNANMTWDFDLVLPYQTKLELTVAHDGRTYYLPDPATWNYTVGDLDSSGSRDANGLLHRSYVATKVNYEFEWNALEWKMLMYILEAVQKDKFTFTGPDPRSFRNQYSGDYYVGDRTGSAEYFMPSREEYALFSLKLKFIEY